MSQHAETKRHFKLAMVQGIPPVAPSRAHAERWTNQFLEVLPLPGVPKTPRLINAFKVGADPEFVFADLDRGTRSDAEIFRLKTGLAFGADMNGRLVELRPRASRFALNVLSSVLEELRWLAAYNRETLAFAWRAGAFLYKDGIGGHVHLGRKKGLKPVRAWASYFNAQHGRHRAPRWEEDVTVKPEQPEELRRMDLIFYALTELGVYNKSQVVQRQAGDQHGQQYGMFGDVRMQAHGYEYRAYPSWLDHPLSAYLALVLTKLAAYDPEVLPNPNKMPENVEFCHKLIKNFLAYYKGRDDDAALAYAALCRHGLPVYCGDDFKQRWGINTALQRAITIPRYIPDVITGHEDTTRELFEYLHNGKALPPSNPRQTWNGTIPDAYQCCLGRIESTRGQRGLGELAFDLFHHAKYPVYLAVTNERDFMVSKSLGRKKEGIRLAKKLGIRILMGGGIGQVRVPPQWREPMNLASTKKLLTALLPLWTPEMLQAGVKEEPIEAKQRFVGTQIA